MRRRDVLVTTAAFTIGAAAGLPAIGAVHDAPMTAQSDPSIALADHVLRAYPSRESLAAIGDAFLQEEAAGGDHRAGLHAALRDLLGHLAMPDEVVRTMPPAAIRTSIKSATAEDFSRGRMVAVRGWLLGETEVKLCRIAALCAA